MNINLETYYTKKELSKGMKQHKFYYKVDNYNNKRGYNKLIKVYMLCKDYSPLCIGRVDANTASYRGDYASAVNVISEIFNYKNDDYNILDNRVLIKEIY